MRRIGLMFLIPLAKPHQQREDRTAGEQEFHQEVGTDLLEAGSDPDQVGGVHRRTFLQLSSYLP